MEKFQVTREHNWADNYTFTAARIHRPGTIDEVRRLVATARRIRAVGARHSYNGIADSAGEMIDLGGLPPDFAIDRERMTVTVGANTSYGALAAYLQTQGYALRNTASLPHVTVAGAVATGTHGSGDANGALGTAVAGLELATATGDLLSIRRGDDGFDGIVVGLGAFGVVTRMTLDIIPSFDVRQDAFVGLPWNSLLANFDAIFAAAYSVSVLTKWTGEAVDRLWLKTCVIDGAPHEVTAAQFGATSVPMPFVAGGLEDASSLLNPFGGVPGPWSERLPHFRTDVAIVPAEQIQSEYMLPRTNAVAALEALRALGDRIDPLLLASEIRTVAADALWLSSCYGHATVALHFTWMKQPAEVDAITRRIEDMLLPLGARPHWGKLMHAGADRLAPLYPRLDDFRALAKRYDPAGKFRNAFLERHVFG